MKRNELFELNIPFEKVEITDACIDMHFKTDSNGNQCEIPVVVVPIEFELDEAAIPVMEYTDENLEIACWEILLSSATDRNIIVYDADAPSGDITPRLAALMKVVLRRNRHEYDRNNLIMRKLYLSEDVYSEYKYGWEQDAILNVELCLMPNYKHMLAYYLHKLGGSLPSGDTDLCLGTSDNSQNALFYKVDEHDNVTHYGIAVLNNQRAILGSY